MRNKEIEVLMSELLSEDGRVKVTVGFGQAITDRSAMNMTLPATGISVMTRIVPGCTYIGIQCIT